MAQLVDQLQVKLKKTSTGFFIFFLRLISGFLLGLTFALIGKEMIGFSHLVFVFLIIFVMGIFLRISRNWGIFSILLFNALCFLCAVLLKMYILIAPGA